MSRSLGPRLVAVAVAVFAVAACTAPARTQRVPGVGPALSATVVEVIDGDTLEVRIGGQRERIRLLGVDTPETVHPTKPVECFGPEASARTKQLLPPGTDVLLQRDREARDRYGRLLAYLWRAADHVFVNELLLAEGDGELLVIAPNTTRRPELAAAERAARTEQRGRWGSCPADRPGR